MIGPVVGFAKLIEEHILHVKRPATPGQGNAKHTKHSVFEVGVSEHIKPAHIVGFACSGPRVNGVFGVIVTVFGRGRAC